MGLEPAPVGQGVLYEYNAEDVFVRGTLEAPPRGDGAPLIDEEREAPRGAPERTRGAGR
jgi:hypothetical protein